MVLFVKQNLNFRHMPENLHPCIDYFPCGQLNFLINIIYKENYKEIINLWHTGNHFQASSEAGSGIKLTNSTTD